MEKSIGVPSVSTGMGITAGYFILQTCSSQYQVILIQKFLESIFVLSVFIIGCFAVACGIGQWLQQNKESKKYSALTSFSISTLSEISIPSFGASYFTSKIGEIDVQILITQYIGVMGIIGFILIVIGVYIIKTYVK